MNDIDRSLQTLLQTPRHFSLDQRGTTLKIKTADSLRSGMLMLFAFVGFGISMAVAERFGPVALGIQGMVGDGMLAFFSFLAALILVFLFYYRSYFTIDLGDPLHGKIEWVQEMDGKAIRTLRGARREVKALELAELRHPAPAAWSEFRIELLIAGGERLAVVSGHETKNQPELYRQAAAHLAAILRVPWEKLPAKRIVGWGEITMFDDRL